MSIYGDLYWTKSGPEPEPCDNCELGLLWIYSYEDRRLCRNCVIEQADKMGWLDDWERFVKPLVTPPPVETAVEAAPKQEDVQDSGQSSLF